MIRVNLLPHRTAFRQQQILEHVIVFVGVVLVALALVIAVNMMASQTFSDLQDEVTSLKAENQVLSRKIGALSGLDNLRQDVEAKLAIVDELQAGRFRSLKTLYEIANSLPENIWLDRVADRAGALSISGTGESSKAVANLMRALSESEAFADVGLTVDQILELDGMELRQFSLTFRGLTLAEQEKAIADAEQAASEVSP